MKYIVFILIVLSVTACSGMGSSSGGSGSVGGRNYLALKYKNGDVSSQSSLDADDNIPILFGTMAVTGFQYGPKAVKLGAADSDYWSIWQIVPQGLQSASDFLLPTGGEVDLKELANGLGYDGSAGFLVDISSNPDYVREVGTFSFDLLEVWAMLSPINSSNAVCGSQYLAYAMYSAFPDLSFGICNHLIIESSFDGRQINGLHVLFARRDWFPDAIQIYYESDQMTGATYPCFHSSTLLDDFQAEIVTSYLKMRYGAVAAGITYDQACPIHPSAQTVPVSIIPQSGDVPVVKFTEYKVPVPASITEDGLEVPESEESVFGVDLEAVVSFNLKPSMIQNYIEFNDTSDPSDIILDPAADGTPWGLAVEFRALAPPVIEE